MTRNNGLSMTGKNITQLLTLKGYNSLSNEMPLEIKNIKITIMNLIIIPFLAKQWKKLEENICFIDNLTKKINLYLSLYDSNEYLLLYKDLLIAFEIAVLQHIEITNLEKYFKNEDEKTVSTIVFKTTLIRLRPEYEIYNLIVGKPIYGEKYNIHILNDILKLLDLNDINFENIKKYLTNKYTNKCAD